MNNSSANLGSAAIISRELESLVDGSSLSSAQFSPDLSTVRSISQALPSHRLISKLQIHPPSFALATASTVHITPAY